MNIQKSLLRYPGGKSRAVQKIVKYIPKDVTEILSPQSIPIKERCVNN